MRDYLEVRGLGARLPEQVFLIRRSPLTRSYCYERLKTYGERCQVNITPHQLRHSCATLLLNAGAPVLSVQTRLGHKWVNTTLGYGRAHDQAVEADYFAAMNRVEARLALAPVEEEPAKPVEADQRQKLLALAEQLAQPEMSSEQRLALAQRIRVMLVGEPVYEQP